MSNHSAKKRRLGFEGLEHRQMLSTVGLNSISNVTLPAGTSVMVALNGTDTGNTVQFGVTSSNSADVTPIVMPNSNPNLQFNIAGVGSMTFQLFQNLTPNTVSWIESLVNGDLYNGDYIYRAETGSFALIQGGNNPPQINSGADVNPLPASVGSQTTIDEEFNPDLNYTTAGELAMARQSGPNTSSTEFFVTDGATRSLDYAYTLFGFMTSGQSVLTALDAEPTTANSDGIHYLNTPIKITSASILSDTDTQNGVLMLRAPTTASGSYTVSVTAYDGTNTPTTQTFTVNVETDTAIGTSGVTTNPWASQAPAPPTGVTFQPGAGQGTSTFTSLNNSSTSTELSFLVSGVTVGDAVTLYADGAAIGTADATSTSVTITTNGTSTLTAGSHTFTATETKLGVAVTDNGDNSLSESANVDSYDSPAVQVQVVTSLSVTSTPATSAKVGQAYTYIVETNAPSGDTFTVTPVTKPSGMTFDSTTNTFTWTPTSAEVNTAPAFSASVTDSLGHTATIGPVDIAVSAGVPPTTIPANSAGGDVTVLFSGNQVLVYDNIKKQVLTSSVFDSTDSVTINATAGQANSVLIIVPGSSNDPLPENVTVNGAGSTNNQVTVFGASGTNNFLLNGTTASDNGLVTNMSSVQKVTLAGMSGNSYYTLTNSSEAAWVVDTGGYNTLDFSHDTAGVDVNLGLDKGQAQMIAPWSNTLSIDGVIDELIGSEFNNVLTGGPAATTLIRSGEGNNTVTGGSGNNVLLGGGGQDTITGGPGENLIIGGAGNSSLYAKGTENIIFAGETTDDSSNPALLDLLAQGTRASYGYSVRRILASSAGNSSIQSDPVTFLDMGAADTIYGSQLGNWFVLGSNTTVKP
jgi:cyclophilin family peptidyl-prolyl cis-trans isomerase